MKLKNCVFLLLIIFLSFSICSANDDMLDEFEEEMAIEEIYDPLNRYNRVMTDFNDGLYINVFNPMSEGYSYIFNKDIRDSVDNFFTNLYFPVRFTNNILQGKFINATEEIGRFIINSTFGVFGLFDYATNESVFEAHNEDFGQTLGFYGIESGPHIVLPIFGPSNLRDIVGMVPDAYISPFDSRDIKSYNITDTWPELIGSKAYEGINSYSLDKKQYEKLKEDSVDLYPYLRDVYEQYRDKQIKE